MPRPPVQTIADELFFTTVFIESTTATGSSSGTGFLILYPRGSGSVPVLVTNKHVFAGANQATFTMTRSDRDVPATSGTRMTINDFGTHSWVGHPDSAVDVAAMFFNPVLEAMAGNDAPAFFRAFTPDQLINQDAANELDAIEAVTFLGYPNGLFDRSSMSPIARRGQTATPIFNDYNNLPAFLIDASVFPGSSGSPVVLFDRGSYTTRDGTTHIGSRLALLGVVAAVHTRRVNGEVHMVSRATTSFEDVIDLGIVFKASSIQETVFALFTSAGVPISEAVPPTESLA
jgi:hypothetical protein